MVIDYPINDFLLAIFRQLQENEFMCAIIRKLRKLGTSMAGGFTIWKQGKQCLIKKP